MPPSRRSPHHSHSQEVSRLSQEVSRLNAELDSAKKAADEAQIALELGHGGRAEADEALQQLAQVRLPLSLPLSLSFHTSVPSSLPL